jgi:tripartite-type tricarboxylate transporter receptor subunit TctC
MARARILLPDRVMLRILILLFLCGPALAQDYPSRPIRILVGFSAGSTTDILARTVGQKMNESWGHPVIVDNRPSSGGIVASGAVASAAPEGYTLLVVSAGHAATAAMFTKLPYDTLK